MLRRLTASLLAVFMLHLSFLGADLACSKHGDESARTDAGETSHSAHAAASAHDMSAHRQAAASGGAHTSHVPAQHPSLSNASDEAPCEIPAQSNCCQAFMGCSIVFSPNTEITVAASNAPRAMNASNAQRAPMSDVPAPEPPPPRA